MPRLLVLIVQAANGSAVELIRRLPQAPATAIVVVAGQDAPTFADAVMGLGLVDTCSPARPGVSFYTRFAAPPTGSRTSAREWPCGMRRFGASVERIV